MAFPENRRGDLQMLQMLHLLEVERIGPDAVAERFGLTRGAIAGLRHRTSGAARKAPCACKKAENRDGGMPALWWKGAA